MFILEITCSLSVSNRLGRISFINLNYCLLGKNESDPLELSISVYNYMLGSERVNYNYIFYSTDEVYAVIFYHMKKFYNLRA